MSYQAVEAVFFWRYFESPYRAAYGRLSGGTTKYTKKYFQSSGEQWAELNRVLRYGDENKIAVEFRWPSDAALVGEYRKATDERGQLAWPETDAPLPWRVGDPANPAITVAGDPSFTTEVDADAELERIKALGRQPWAVAVKLFGEDRVLHPRMYLGYPPPGSENRSISVLPGAVRRAIERLPGNVGGGVVTFGQVRAPELVHRILNALHRDPNVLLVGPPGTGKTVAMEDLRSLFDGTQIALFDPTVWDGAWERDPIPGTTHKAVALVFHPSYSYEDFVAGLVPRTEGGNFSLVARPGPLLSMAHWASDPERTGLLILDEFNRGPTAAIFGDTLALLDAAKRHDTSAGRIGAAIQRPHPHEKMEVGKEFETARGLAVPSEVRLPASLWILAALNSTDRSVAPLDAALRRRFAILNVPPDYDVLARHFGIQLPQGAEFVPSDPDPAAWSSDDVKQLALCLLFKLNERLNVVLGPDFLLGQALLWNVNGTSGVEAGRSLALAFDQRIAATLRLTFVDQDEALAAILNIGQPPAAGVTATVRDDHLAYWVTPTPALQSVATPRLEIRSSAALSWAAASRAFRGLL